MAVDIRRDEIFQTPGRYGWTGGFGTSAYTDPAEGMIGILFTQRMIDSPEPPTWPSRSLRAGAASPLKSPRRERSDKDWQFSGQEGRAQ
jgi:CubicO group peptidase (beta-lactamase class C family)